MRDGGGCPWTDGCLGPIGGAGTMHDSNCRIRPRLDDLDHEIAAQLVNGLTVAEIAEAVSVSRDATKKRIGKLYEHMRNHDGRDLPNRASLVAALLSVLLFALAALAGAAFYPWW